MPKKKQYKILIICENCKEEREVWKSKNVLFCSLFCFTEYKYKSYIKNWKLGLESGGQGDGYGKVSNYVRRYLFEINNSRCQECGWSKINTVTKTIPLEVEHCDGNSRNHSESNLKLLCPNCHSLTAGHSTKKGNGRRYYREHYLSSN